MQTRSILLTLLMMPMCGLIGHAQTSWTIEGMNPGMYEYDGNLPPLFMRGFLPMPPLGPIAPPFGGDDVDRFSATLWATDGFLIGNFDMAGKLLVVGAPPAPFQPLTGLAHDSIGYTAPNPPGSLWITDGFVAGAVLAMPPFPLIVPPFPVVSPTGGFATGVAFDSRAAFPGGLWICFADGWVGSYAVNGVPMMFWRATPPLAPQLLGISFDTSDPAGALLVTDGVMQARFTTFGALAPPSFYAPLPVFPVPAAPWGAAFPVLGLGHSPEPLPYTFGGVFPAKLDAVRNPAIAAQTWAGNAAFSISVVGLPPNPPLAFLVVGLASLGGPLLVGPPWWFFPVGTVGGMATVPMPIPGWVPPGIGVYLQFVHQNALGGLTYSNGLYFTTSTL